mmetsp:Transcript_6901/g.28255  ORF Transcript_6901/g.28255 Transcript_6901/m.28255 type:complete len:240 (-) Transcript_6901:476-1195(-)
MRASQRNMSSSMYSPIPSCTSLVSMVHCPTLTSLTKEPSAHAAMSAARASPAAHAPSSSGYHTPGAVPPASIDDANAATAVAAESVRCLCATTLTTLRPPTVSMSTRMAVSSPTLSSKNLTSGSSTPASLSMAPLSLSSERGASDATSSIPQFQKSGDVAKRALTVRAPSTSRALSTSGRLSRYTRRLPTLGPKSATRLPDMGASDSSLPSSYASTSSPSSMRLVARMVRPAPPLPAVQ